MADALKKKYGANVELIEGGGGVFDVRVNGTQVLDKHDVGRFPEHDEIIAAIRAM